ncbi:SIS domain-containing protein [bacterium]|nr:SIS domain-containing protein [bacterium]
MEIEIFAQCGIIKQILGNYISNGEININVPDNVNRVILVASGSSYHCARYCACLLGSVANIEARAIYSSEFIIQPKIAEGEDILYIFITQSGETTDTNSALMRAKKHRVKTLCITNNENSSIWNESEYHIACLAGEEKSIAATKSLSSQLICALLLVLKLAQTKNIDVKHLIRDLNDLTDVIEQAYKLHTKIKQTAKFLSKYKNVVITADGDMYAFAKEASLKIKETSYINTCSYILGEFMHGHVAVLNNAKSAVIYISNGELNYETVKNLNNIKENYKPPIIIIGNRTNQIKSTYNLNIDCQKPIIKTFGIIVILQLLALEIALKLHKNVDKPHGLKKIVK